MGIFAGAKGWLFVAAVAGIAAGATAAQAWVSGPSISLGANPIKAIAFDVTLSGDVTDPNSGKVVQPGVKVVKKLVYEVPQGQIFVLSGLYSVRSELETGGTFGAVASLLIDGMPVDGASNPTVGGEGGWHRLYSRGEIAGPGSKIEAVVFGNPPDKSTVTATFSLRGTLESK